MFALITYMIYSNYLLDLNEYNRLLEERNACLKEMNLEKMTQWNSLEQLKHF